MELISKNLNIDFIGTRYVWAAISLLVIAVSIYTWFDKGEEKFSVDFVGGTDIVVHFENPIKIGQVRAAIKEAGITGATVQSFEHGKSDFSIRLKADKNSETGEIIREALSGISGNTATWLKEDYVGPIIGEQIRDDGLKAMAFALVCILLYISFRFEWRFAVGAVAALVHDVIVMTGLFILSGGEISAAVLAAILTVIGYSINDTIIIYDRVRENLTEAYKGEDKKRQSSDARQLSKMTLSQILNLSINQTMSRTILTTMTTLLVVLALWLLGGGAVKDLAFALVIGLIAGTYSTVFIACPVVMLFEPKKVRNERVAA